MAVPEQTPYIEHTGNGVTTSFSLGFQCESKDHLIVLVDDIEPPIATWSLTGGNVVFTTAPAAGKKITLQRNTPFGRTTNYQSFNNSFRPQTVNVDFDRIWLKLQELGVADWLMKLYVDRLHQQQEQKINDLKGYVDDRDDELRAYLMEEIRKQGVALDQLDEYYNYLMERLAQIAVDKGWDSSFVVHKGQTQYEINEDFFNKKWEKVSVKDFGAKGNGDQNLYATDYYSDHDKSIHITQQTADGLAFNRAIKWLRNKGGGSLYIPPCDAGSHYSVYGYLEVIDFPCVIYGAGANSLIKNCDNSPTNSHGYGIFCVQPQNYEEISFLNFKVDGNAEVRIKPTVEFRQYPLAIYGKPQLKMFGITSVNSPIDCFMTAYVDNDSNTYVKTVNCHFDNSFRNTVSLVSGWNQYHVNMTVDRGGYVHGGTQPRYGMDIEPNLVGRSIENLHFTNCQFKRAINVCVGGVWAQAQFDNCTFDGSLAHTSKLTDKTYPWLFQLTEGKWQLNNCRFIGRDDYMQNASHHFNAYSVNSKFNDSQYFKLHSCVWEKCGFTSTSRSVEMINCSAQNSLHPFIFSGGSTTNNNDLLIRGLNLKNVFDGGNYGTGMEAAFGVASSLGGKIDIDGVTIEIDATSLKSIPKELFTKTRYYGVSINPSKSATAGKRVFIKNVHSEGFYKRLPTYLDRVVNSGNMRDWGFPALPPENTIKLESAVTATLVDGTVANNQVTNKSVTGSAIENSLSSSRTLGNKGAVYQTCTMWGDYS